jgi:hypothetical protein
VSLNEGLSEQQRADLIEFIHITLAEVMLPPRRAPAVGSLFERLFGRE